NIAKAKLQLETAEKQHHQAVKAEAHARKELKASAHKVQYTAAMRELDEKERQLEIAQRALAETNAIIKSLEAENENQISSRNEYQRQFDELHEIFLAEHENQVTAKDRLTKQVAELEGNLDAAALNKFNRLIQNRGGKAVVPVENNTCTGCNTKLRTPLIYQIKAEGSMTCEYCQRILYLP
ncbi:MAG: C4-type zinc ribbon domain-containing protein, partial [Holophagales bacterium]|nr:C4-type zinc ribbon domain-containing protein [Holophagales bacterium]